MISACSGSTWVAKGRSLQGFIAVAHCLLSAIGINGFAAERPPNIVIIFTDDQGYADVGCFDAKGYVTPNLDRMAREGVRFTDFHVASPVCSASRAALLTGCYPPRVGIRGALPPHSKRGLNPEEMTLAEICKQRGYATGMVGKWHLGDRPEWMPTRQGFDEFFGLPYSHDMWPYHPEAKPGTYGLLPLYEGDKIIDPELTPEKLTQLTSQYTGRAVSFIERHKHEPFFLYLAHSLPHVPLFVSEKFKNRSGAGLYGDVIEELDWSVGEVLAALQRTGLESQTLVLFSSDNGPWLSYGEHAGSAAPYREGKGTSWEGGTRVPFIARWPGKIPAGKTCTEPTMTIDVLPTIARLLGAALPPRKIDGLDIWPLLSAEPGARSPHDAYAFYYADDELQAIRSGPWKLIFPHTYRTLAGRPGGKDGQPVKYENTDAGLELYNLADDPAEKSNLANTNPEVVKRLELFAEQFRAKLGDKLTKREGTEVRSVGQASSLP